MSKKYTKAQLRAFIKRAKTPEQIEIASDWFIEHIHDELLFQELQRALTTRLLQIKIEMRREQSA